MILPTNMDGDGTQKGCDLKSAKAVSDVVDLPVVASGGVGILDFLISKALPGQA